MPTDTTPTLDVFDRAWELLAAKGRCDARGSMEYVRVRGQWDRMMGLLLAVDFIAQAANQLPPLPEVMTFAEQLNDLLPPVPQVPDPPTVNNGQEQR